MNMGNALGEPIKRHLTRWLQHADVTMLLFPRIQTWRWWRPLSGDRSSSAASSTQNHQEEMEDMVTEGMCAIDGRPLPKMSA